MSNTIRDEATLKSYFAGGKMPNSSNYSDLITTIFGGISPVSVPVTPTSSGVQGSWAYDGTYIYWCISTNTWVRMIAVTSW